MTFQIRPIAAPDLDRVLLLAGESDDAPRWSRPDYERILLAGPSDLLSRCGLVALSGANLVAFAVVSWLRPEPTAEIEALFVARLHRRRGIGGALIGDCIAWAAKAGASSVRLEVRASNVSALALYHRHGFSAAGVRRAYYSAPVEDAVLLQVPLPL
jgi:ribosomal-protein-alanine N-acetyltransferase